MDDRPANLDVVEEILKSDRFELFRALSGKRALELLLEHEFACCLLDIRMPEMDGFQTAEYIRRDENLKYLPILFVTAEAGDQANLFKGYETGAVDFLIKPIEPFVLRSKVNVFADLYKQRKELERTKEIDELNRKLAKLNQELMSINADLEHFTHMASHDMREPIRKQLNLLNVLRDLLERPRSEEIEKIIAEMQRSANQSLGMIDDFRTLAKIGYKQMKRTPVDLKKLIDECLEEHTKEIRRRGVEVRFDEYPREVNVYESLVRRFYDNMVRNALDHVHSDGFLLHFTARADAESGWVFGVKNTGSSIPKTAFEDIFKMYRNMDPFSPGSTGIGLTICKKIVDRHRGAIEVESENDFVHFKFTFGAI